MNRKHNLNKTSSKKVRVIVNVYVKIYKHAVVALWLSTNLEGIVTIDIAILREKYKEEGTQNTNKTETHTLMTRQ